MRLSSDVRAASEASNVVASYCRRLRKKVETKNWYLFTDNVSTCSSSSRIFIILALMHHIFPSWKAYVDVQCIIILAKLVESVAIILSQLQKIPLYEYTHYIVIVDFVISVAFKSTTPYVREYPPSLVMVRYCLFFFCNSNRNCCQSLERPVYGSRANGRSMYMYTVIYLFSCCNVCWDAHLLEV